MPFFVVAIFIAIVKSSVEEGNLTSREAFIMLQMLLAFLLAVVSTGSIKWALLAYIAIFIEGRWERISRIQGLMTELGLAWRNVSPLGTSARSCLAVAIASYNVWFWSVV